MARISEEQSRIINSFHCERLSSNEENKELIKNFTSEKGKSLVAYLNEKAWQEDVDGVTAYYLIKSDENDIAMFFSLKCGSLFEIMLQEENLRQKIEFAEKTCVLANSTDEEGQRLFAQRLEQYQQGKSVPPKVFLDILKFGIEQNRTLLQRVCGDKQREENEQIIRVYSTYPGIELVHFCLNDGIREKWKSLGVQHPMGEVMFWTHIAPLIYEIQMRIGCQYVFLFAADLSEDGVLINYYDIALKFKKNPKFGTNKPLYDFCCEFMCQEICELRKNREVYFDNFNPDEEDDVI